MMKPMRDSKLPSDTCFVHTLQLTLNDTFSTFVKCYPESSCHSRTPQSTSLSVASQCSTQMVFDVK
ncbi:hypothetical protein ACJMK2_023826 [Sinanodonta woodiana]|uniref:Uncharacterized protein n=1 Tax=Sinanodonta woodiana TaxID=1069815 RepID=A0ABD3T701_SINWO